MKSISENGEYKGEEPEGSGCLPDTSGKETIADAALSVRIDRWLRQQDATVRLLFIGRYRNLYLPFSRLRPSRILPSRDDCP